MKRNMRESIKLITNTNIQETETERKLNQREKNRKQNTENKWAIIQETQRLATENYTKSEIAKILKISRQTVYTYLEQKIPLEKTTVCILDKYIPRIKELILENYKMKDIYQIIKEEGYTGKQTLFNSKITAIRYELKTNTKYLKRSDLKKILFTKVNDLTDGTIKEQIQEYLETNTEFKTMIELLHSFKEIFKSKNVRKLSYWLKEAAKTNVKELNSFVKLINSDYEAVKNAVIYDYSNGLTEGFNNKTKVIKRIMYGRCSFELLRLKVLN